MDHIASASATHPVTQVDNIANIKNIEKKDQILLKFSGYVCMRKTNPIFSPLHGFKETTWQGANCAIFIFEHAAVENSKYVHVEASRTRGTTALAYCLINSSLHAGTVHRWWSTPKWLDGHQGCSQLSTYICM
jgi:hypothetical protein